MMNMITTRTEHKAMISVLLSIFMLINLSSIAHAQAAQAGTGTLHGAVSTTAPDGQSYNIPAASLKLSSTAEDTKVLSASTNDAGEYEFAGLQPGTYTLSADVQGFKTASKLVTIRAGETTIENITLQVADVNEPVTVNANSQEVDTTDASPAATFTQNTLQSVPLINERFLDALPLIPSVVRGPDGQIDVKGGRPAVPPSAARPDSSSSTLFLILFVAISD